MGKATSTILISHEEEIATLSTNRVHDFGHGNVLPQPRKALELWPYSVFFTDHEERSLLFSSDQNQSQYCITFKNGGILH